MKKLFLLIMLLLGMHAYSQNYYTRETIEGTHATYFSLSWLADGYNIIANTIPVSIRRPFTKMVRLYIRILINVSVRAILTVRF